MPRYFFNVRDGHDLPDELGTELVNDDAARKEAVRAAAQMLLDVHDRFWDQGYWIMTVLDEDDRQVCMLTFSGQVQHQSQEYPHMM